MCVTDRGPELEWRSVAPISGEAHLMVLKAKRPKKTVCRRL